MSVSKGYLNN